MDFTIKQHSTLPPLQVQLTDSGGYPYDLRYADVVFRMVKRGATYAKIGAFAQVDDAEGGRVRYVWLQQDVDTAGVYRAEFDVTDSLGGIRTWPEEDYFLVEVVQDLTPNLSNPTTPPTVPDVPAAAPDPPLNVAAVDAGSSAIEITWDASVGADTYNLLFSLVSGGPYEQIWNGADLSVFHSGLTPGVTYYYVVQAVGVGGTSAYSDEVNAIPSP